MNERYLIRVRGILGPLMRLTFGEMRCEAMPRQYTLRGRLSTDDLDRLLKLLDRSGVELVHLDGAPK
jgi:hypothetical protein